ncbi:hypothetical protein [Streptomyces sp. CBMA156]|uniref:hypothetical protein n=1 Tax=Streptomyces sp. CBMA156 TaxID=1930280 RepID=UPI001661FBC8|nr:hypothetical protein [Streptomyces sp. CBMA156]MBD0670063.1 hypothetical protein [Streptomyces sp. CBMA156]
MTDYETATLDHLMGCSRQAEHLARQVRYTPGTLIWHAVEGCAATGRAREDIARSTNRLLFGPGLLRGGTGTAVVNRFAGLLIAQWAAERAAGHPALAAAHGLHGALAGAIRAIWLPGTGRIGRLGAGHSSLYTSYRRRTIQALARQTESHRRAAHAARIHDVLTYLRSYTMTATVSGWQKADTVLVTRYGHTPFKTDGGTLLGPALAAILDGSAGRTAPAPNIVVLPDENEGTVAEPTTLPPGEEQPLTDLQQLKARAEHAVRSLLPQGGPQLDIRQGRLRLFLTDDSGDRRHKVDLIGAALAGAGLTATFRDSPVDALRRFAEVDALGEALGMDLGPVFDPDTDRAGALEAFSFLVVTPARNENAASPDA